MIISHVVRSLQRPHNKKVRLIKDQGVFVCRQDESELWQNSLLSSARYIFHMHCFLFYFYN